MYILFVIQNGTHVHSIHSTILWNGCPSKIKECWQNIIPCSKLKIVTISPQATNNLFNTFVVRPTFICPGHQAIAGTLKPPSQVDTLPHLNGPALPPYSPCSRSGLHGEK